MTSTLLLFSPFIVCASFYTEELSIDSLLPSGAVSSLPLSLVTYTFTHTASPASTASYFPPHWRDFVGHSGVNAMVASVTRGSVPYGWSLPASTTSNPFDLPRGAYLYMNFSLEEEEGPPHTRTSSPAALAAAWDRASHWLARAAGTSFTGSGTVPHTTPSSSSSSSWSDVTPKRGVRRAWYTFPVLSTPPTAMLHVLPRATACSEALWGVVSATPCRSHAGLGAALVPSLIFQAPWYSIEWGLDKGVLVSKVSVVMTVAGVEKEGGEGGEGGDASSSTTTPSNSSSSHTTALLAAVREALKIPQDWGGDVGRGVGRGAVCPLSHHSAVVINGKKYPLRALAGFDDDGGGRGDDESEGGEEEGGDDKIDSGGGGTLPLRPLQACLDTQRTVSTPSSFPLGSGTVLLSIRNRCKDMSGGGGGGGASTSLSPSSTWIFVENPLPWMFTAVQGSALAWVEREGEEEKGGAFSSTASIPVNLVPTAGFSQGGECGESSSSSSSSTSAHISPSTGQVWCMGGLPYPPPSTTLHLVFAFAPQGGVGVLHSEEGPPDPARGMEIPPGRVSLCTTTITAIANTSAAFDDAVAGQKQEQVQLRWWGAGGVVMVPTPDAAMPYNVVVLCSTVCAFGVGTLVNALARKRGGGGGKKKKEKEKEKGWQQGGGWGWKGLCGGGRKDLS